MSLGRWAIGVQRFYILTMITNSKQKLSMNLGTQDVKVINEAYLRKDRLFSLLRGQHRIEMSVILNIECSSESTLNEVVLQ